MDRVSARLTGNPMIRGLTVKGEQAVTQISAHTEEGRILARIKRSGAADLAAAAMPPLSHLECMTCGRREDIGSVADKLRDGWPTCHGYTMRLFTMREVEQADPLT